MVALDTGPQDQIQSLCQTGCRVSGPFLFLTGALMGGHLGSNCGPSAPGCVHCSFQPWSIQEAALGAWALSSSVKAALVFQGV